MKTRSMIMGLVAIAIFLAAGCKSKQAERQAEEKRKKASFGVPVQIILAIHVRDDGGGCCCGTGGDEGNWMIVNWDASAPEQSQKVVLLNDRVRDETVADVAAVTGQLPKLNFTLDAARFSPDGKLLAGRTSMDFHVESISVWETETGRQVMSFTSFEFGPSLVGFTPDGKGVLYREEGGTEHPIHRIDISSSVAAPWGGKNFQGMEVLSSDGNLAASHGSHEEFGGDPNDFLQLWDTRSVKMLQEIRTAHVQPKLNSPGFVKSFEGFEGFSFSPDNRFFACTYSTWEGDPRVNQGYRDVGISESAVALWNIGEARVCEQYFTRRVGRSDVLAFSMDGKWLAVGTSIPEGSINPSSIRLLKVGPAGFRDN